MDTAGKTPSTLSDPVGSTQKSQLRQGFDAERPLYYFEARLYDIWYLLIEAAKHTDASSFLQDTLVVQTLMVGQLADVIFEINTGQNLWTDLPFLGEDLEIAWHSLREVHHDGNDDGDKVRSELTSNLTSFMARLFAASNGPTSLQDSLAACALDVFKDAFETEQTSAQLKSILPLANLWLQSARRKLATLSSQQKQLSPGSPPGPLLETHSEDTSQTGFSITRWKHWTRRIEELGKSEDGELKKLADAARYWINEWEETLPQATLITLR
ncbi:hypothetical protein F4777DRAFT_595742 [Nemania sp. FL0916]|nr:hypothetical protein F4777DRAFT_595742 [Nemania sp. FL0916]